MKALYRHLDYGAGDWKECGEQFDIDWIHKQVAPRWTASINTIDRKVVDLVRRPNTQSAFAHSFQYKFPNEIAAAIVVLEIAKADA